MTDKAPSAVVLFEAPGAMCCGGVKSCNLDFLVFVELVAAKSCECVEVLLAGVTSVYRCLLWVMFGGVYCFNT